VPTCVLYLAFGELILAIYSDEEQKKKTGKSIMIAISMASMIGGISTPVGSTVNILASNIMETTLGETISFARWMSICVPVVVIMIPLCWKIIMLLFKPAPISDKDRIQFIESFAQKEKMTGKEIKTLVIFTLMLILWFASSWIKSISTMHVMFLGVCIMALPKIGVTDIDKIVKEIKFDILLLIATILTLCNAMMNQGFGEWLTSFVPKVHVSPVLFILAVMFCIYVLLLIVPIAPSLTMVVVPVVIVIAQQMGINPIMMIPICSISIGCGYLLPMDSVFLMTYGKGYYSIKDFVKVSACIMAAAMVLAISVAYGILYFWKMV
jgi:sodium-dependent dicarboxylate transporter 2/3/5